MRNCALTALLVAVLPGSVQGQGLAEPLVLVENTSVTRGDQRGRILAVETALPTGDSQREVFIATPSGSTARIFERSEPLDDRWRYIVRFEESGWEAELWYESSLSYETMEDMFNVAHQMRDQIEAGTYEIMTKFTFGPQVYAKTRGPFLQLNQIGTALAPQIEETALLAEIPREVCDTVSFLRESGAAPGGGNLDLLFGLVAYALEPPQSVHEDSEGAKSAGTSSNCASSSKAYSKAEHGEWDVKKLREQGRAEEVTTTLPKSWKQFQARFAGTAPKLRMKSPN